MNVTRKELAEMLSNEFGERVTVDQIRKNEAALGLEAARNDLHARAVRYDKDRAIAGFRARGRRRKKTA